METARKSNTNVLGPGRNSLTQIARRHLGIETLEVRNSDRLDFHEVGVAGVSQALDAAYIAGQAELLAAAEALLAAKTDPAAWRALERAVKKARKNT